MRLRPSGAHTYSELWKNFFLWLTCLSWDSCSLTALKPLILITSGGKIWLSFNLSTLTPVNDWMVLRYSVNELLGPTARLGQYPSNSKTRWVVKKFLDKVNSVRDSNVNSFPEVPYPYYSLTVNSWPCHSWLHCWPTNESTSKHWSSPCAYKAAKVSTLGLCHYPSRHICTLATQHRIKCPVLVSPTIYLQSEWKQDANFQSLKPPTGRECEPCTLHEVEQSTICVWRQWGKTKYLQQWNVWKSQCQDVSILLQQFTSWNSQNSKY